MVLFDGLKSGDHHLRLVVHPRWCMISSINSMTRTVDRADLYFLKLRMFSPVYLRNVCQKSRVCERNGKKGNGHQKQTKNGELQIEKGYCI